MTAAARTAAARTAAARTAAARAAAARAAVERAMAEGAAVERAMAEGAMDLVSVVRRSQCSRCHSCKQRAQNPGHHHRMSHQRGSCRSLNKWQPPPPRAEKRG
eukprot:scaffold14771_cov23-Tisochrysis_lutea.AAC.1